MAKFVVVIREVEKVLTEKEYIVEAECLAEAKEKRAKSAAWVDTREVNRTFVDSYVIRCEELK